MSPRLRKIAKWVLYPLCYLFFLGLFAYLTFPFDKLRGRIISEFERAQQRSARRSPAAGQAMKLEIGSIDGYWFSGVEVENAKLTIPPKRNRRAAVTSSKEAPQPMVMEVDLVQARLQVLPLLLGKIRINFYVEALAGTIEGSLPYGDGSGDVELSLQGVQLNDVAPLKAMLQGVPIFGVVDGSLSLSPKEGKFAKADGSLNLDISNVVLGDGKAKLQGVGLPAAKLGQILISANAEAGKLTLEQLSAKGSDLELTGEGKIRLHESWKRARAELYLKFKFTDAYRDRDDATRALLGKPGDKFPPAIELDPSRTFKRAKREDGFYGFALTGPLGNIKVRPQQEPGSKRARRSKRNKRRSGKTAATTKRPPRPAVAARKAAPEPEPPPEPEKAEPPSEPGTVAPSGPEPDSPGRETGRDDAAGDE